MRRLLRPCSASGHAEALQMARSPFPNQIPALIKAFDDEQLLFGSDYCWAPVAFVVRHVASMDGAEQPEGETWRPLTTRNAARLLPRTSGTHTAYVRARATWRAVV